MIYRRRGPTEMKVTVGTVTRARRPSIGLGAEPAGGRGGSEAPTGAVLGYESEVEPELDSMSARPGSVGPTACRSGGRAQYYQ
jgi:hypothetical protein